MNIIFFLNTDSVHIRVCALVFPPRSNFRWKLSTLKHRKMGLCKCPKKKVTNLFCFEHRVNVCENCLVANHAKVNCWNCKSQTSLNHGNYALEGRQDLIGISGTNCHVFVESFHARAITRFSSNICSMIITKGKSFIYSKHC